MSIKRLTVCEEPSPKGTSPCHNEAKGFCTDCRAGICANHAQGHEKFTCSEIKVPDPEPIPLVAVEPVAAEPAKEDEKKGWFK